MTGEENPIVKMLSWRARKLKPAEIVQILAAVASINDSVFTLTDVIELLPDEIASSRKMRRCVGNLLQNLSELGYLSKPSERKWSKNSPSFSHFLNDFILELSSLEKTSRPRREREKIVNLVEEPRRASR